MKSLIEEASSIAKAVEKGWERAGKPHSFTVKVFETPEKNFIGITTKYAKIGIFFDEKQIMSATAPKKEQEAVSPQRTPKKTEAQQPQQAKAPQQRAKQRELPVKPTRQDQPQRPQQTARPAQTPQVVAQQPQHDQEEQLPAWPSEAVNAAHNWLKECLHLIGLPNVEFTTQAHKNNLTINFDAPLVGNEMKETLLYKNLSYLVMAALRTQFKAELKQLKLFLTRE